MLGSKALLLRVLALVLFLPILALVLLSPLLLSSFADRFSSEDLERLSEVGQAYGAIGAILTALTLVGLIATLLIQVRQARVAREEFSRTRQQELVRMLLEDPILAEGVGLPVSTPEETKFSRQRVYINLWINYWFSLYRLGSIDDNELRFLARTEAFRTPAGRFVWKYAADVYRRGERAARKSREFARILDEELEIASNNADASPAASSRNAGAFNVPGLYRIATKSGALIAVSVLILAGLARLVWSRKFTIRRDR